MPRPCRGRDAARPYKGGGLPSAWRRSRSVRTPPPRAGSCSRQRRASSAPCCPRGNTARARAKLCRRRAKISPFPLHLRKRRLFQNMQAPEGAPVAKRRLLCSAMDSGSRLFVCSSCGSGGYCAARRTAGRGSSSALPAEAVVTVRPAPTPRRRPPRWRAWPEGSCPSAHPASSRASPRPSR